MSDNRDALLGLAAVAAGAVGIALLDKLMPKPQPKPWGSAFWLDPELWDRVPYNEKTGRYGNCWDHLESKVIPDAPLAFEKPPPPPEIGEVRFDANTNQAYILTVNGWALLGPGNAFDDNVIDYHGFVRRELWGKVQQHGWVKSGDWDHGYRCELCWHNHTPGYHSRVGGDPVPYGAIWIKKPDFVPWMTSSWKEAA